jgi:hypothetical protein
MAGDARDSKMRTDQAISESRMILQIDLGGSEAILTVAGETLPRRRSVAGRDIAPGVGILMAFHAIPLGDCQRDAGCAGSGGNHRQREVLAVRSMACSARRRCVLSFQRKPRCTMLGDPISDRLPPDDRVARSTVASVLPTRKLPRMRIGVAVIAASVRQTDADRLSPAVTTFARDPPMGARQRIPGGFVGVYRIGRGAETLQTVTRNAVDPSAARLPDLDGVPVTRPARTV